ncbi:MAG: type II secretion system F family protein [Gemmatimonadota bacterium]
MMDRLPPNVMLAILVFAAVACAVIVLAVLWEWWGDRRRQRDLARRLGSVEPSGDGQGGDPFGDLFKEATNADVKWLQPVVARVPHTRDLQHLLDQADMPWQVGTFLLTTIGAAMAFGTMALLITNNTMVAIAAATLAATLPYVYIRRRKTKRLRAFEECFPESIDLLGRAIRAGHAFSTGLQMEADESPEPIAGEFRRVFEEQKFGLSIDDSLLALADRIELVDMRIFVTAVLIQREVGGNLAEILDKISYTIRERFTIERQVRVYTAQGRFTGYLLGILPIAVGFLIFLLNGEYMTVLWERDIGRMLISIAAVLQVIGFFVIRKIINIEV